MIKVGQSGKDKGHLQRMKKNLTRLCLLNKTEKFSVEKCKVIDMREQIHL